MFDKRLDDTEIELAAAHDLMLFYGNDEKAVQMSAYMKDQFEFLGVPTPERKSLCKGFFKAVKPETYIRWDIVEWCWKERAREFQYVGLEYLSLKKDLLTDKDIPRLKELALQKSWWDTIDGLDRIVGDIALRFPKVNKTLLQWSKDDNIWLRRIAIDHQLTRKEKTDTDLLEQIIVNNFASKEFFINKAIGWSLREYSKTNPEWVRGFISRHRDKMASLSIKEGSKYI